MAIRLIAAALLVTCPIGGTRAMAQGDLVPIPPIPRTLPPVAPPLDPDTRRSLEDELSDVSAQLSEFRNKSVNSDLNALWVDVEICRKAVDWAIELGEFYTDKEVAKARQVLKVARERLLELRSGSPSWTKQTGLVVRGYVSALDNSVQPFGLVIPEQYDFQSKTPLYVWLHGRNDRGTELNFLAERMQNKGEFAPSNAIVLHPLGRYCNGFKSAGEIDVLEAIEAVTAMYPIDTERIVLAGFSMGGAGAWHLGAHYNDRWAVIHTGAGFAETAQYQKLTPDKFPPWYEQILWKVYDVPNYTLQLFNSPVVTYSGENDPQIQAARVMEAAFAQHGKQLQHLIGPGMGHKYDEASRRTVQSLLADYVTAGSRPFATEVTLQTPTLRYGKNRWIELCGMATPWENATVHATSSLEPLCITLSTENVTSLRVTSPWRDSQIFHQTLQVAIDNERLELKADPNRDTFSLTRDTTDTPWRVARDDHTDISLRKRPGLQGPIDDAFLNPFLVVMPSGVASHPAVSQWMEFESRHFADRWKRLFRGEVRQKFDHEVTEDDLRHYHLVIWGDVQSNRLLARILEQLPVTWTKNELSVRGMNYDAATHVPVMIYPNPLRPDRYVVINSGITFREGHDRTNSLQNPKLPDWGVIDIQQYPDAFSPGKVVDAGFFDARWKFPATLPKGF